MDHAEGGYLKGKLLLATPTIGDPRFDRSVIYLCAHDHKGAVGLVINHPAPELKFVNLLDELGLFSDIEIPLQNLDFPVLNGGPVESSRGFLLHSSEFKHGDTINVDEDCSVTGTTDMLKTLVRGQIPDKALFVLGYARWTRGQLEQELRQNAWLVAEPDSAFIFDSKPEDKWAKAMDRLGLDPAMLSAETGRA